MSPAPPVLPASTEPADADDPPVILFDGVCNLCSGAVRFIIRHERPPAPGRAPFRFASLQSAAAGSLLAARRAAHADLPDSIILIDRDGLHTRSDAAIRIARGLRRPWRLAAWLAILPRPLRDAGYGLVARWRYRLFGRRDACLVPTPDLAARFLPDPPTPAPPLPSSAR